MKIKGSHNFGTHARTHSQRLESILKIVCDHFSVTRESVRSSNRTHAAARARTIYCWLARLHSKATVNEIGALVNVNITNAHRMIKLIEDSHRTDPDYREAINKILPLIGATNA